MIKKIAICFVALTALAGCATAPSVDRGLSEQQQSQKSLRAKNIVLTIGGVLVLGAIIANEAGSNVKDAVRGAGRP